MTEISHAAGDGQLEANAESDKAEYSYVVVASDGPKALRAMAVRHQADVEMVVSLEARWVPRTWKRNRRRLDDFLHGILGRSMDSRAE